MLPTPDTAAEMELFLGGGVQPGKSGRDPVEEQEEQQSGLQEMDQEQQQEQ